jgi:integrase
MPKLSEELTDTVMKRLPVPETGNVLWRDPVLTGFAGRVTSKGARAYVGIYYFGGIERRDTIGSFPAWKAKAAREVFKRWRREADLEIDPRGEPEPEQADKLLFRLLAEQFLEHGRTKRGRPLRPATKREYRRALLSYATGLHDRAVADVRRVDAAELLRTTATKRGATTAMRTRAAGSRFYSWLIANGYVENNPFTGTEGFETAKRSRVLSNAELRLLWAATSEPGDFNRIIRICLWTGCRRGEAGAMGWSELGDGVWTVPGERTKNHRPLVLPMPRQMRRALEAWPRSVGRDLVFGRGPAGFQAWSQSKARLDGRIARINAERRLGRPLTENEKPANEDALEFDLHDVRRTVETRMAGLGIPKDHVNRVLNHAMAPIAQHYDHHDYADEKAAALQRWADALERIVGEAQPNVVPIRSAS